MFSKFFIEHPIFASVISIVIVLAGLVSVGLLPISQYPEITPPTVEVKASYPGANAAVVAETVAAPIEQEVIGVENMIYMSSVSAGDGSYTPFPYTARLDTVGGSLVTGAKKHFTFPKAGGSCRVGVKGNSATGTFNVRAQRLS